MIRSGWHVYYDAMVRRDRLHALIWSGPTLGDVMRAYERATARAVARRAAAFGAAFESAMRAIHAEVSR